MDIGILFLPAMILIFYFFFIRPQMAQQKKEKELQNSLKKGQLVMTSGGIHGKIIQADEGQSWVKLEIGNATIKVERTAISKNLTVVKSAKKED